MSNRWRILIARCRTLAGRSRRERELDEEIADHLARLADAARAAGVDVTLEVWPEMVHVFQASAGFMPEADAAIERIAEFCRPKLGLD